jgi:hypothetical protein
MLEQLIPASTAADHAMVLEEVEAAMAGIHHRRCQYVNAHEHQFESCAEKSSFVKGWLANFEIADELRIRSHADPAASTWFMCNAPFLLLSFFRSSFVLSSLIQRWSGAVLCCETTPVRLHEVL